MLFNSYAFLFLFLPITVIGFYVLGRVRARYAAWWLVVTSLFFYSFWNPIYLPLLLGSVVVNYLIGRSLARATWRKRYQLILLIVGVTANLGLLGYYKYTDFFIGNINAISGTSLSFLHIILPLGISFFTFTQIAFLVDSYRKIVKEYYLDHYGLFVTFFPHLLAGPIIHHKEMMPQFDDPHTYRLQYKNIAPGLFLIAVGLAKKTVVADMFAQWANGGFNAHAALTFFEAWATALAYTFQIYFDFSGYTDMALGAALLFNIVLPQNFNSPYKALNLQDFWHRWHMTLSRFLREYLYFPLGGSKGTIVRTLANIIIVFVLGGLWHGASWTFVVWGALHGVGMAVSRLWKAYAPIVLPRALSWGLTFIFVVVAWVFFKAKSTPEALHILAGMAGLNGVSLPTAFAHSFLATSGLFSFNGLLTHTQTAYSVSAGVAALIFAATLFFVTRFSNSAEYARTLAPSVRYGMLIIVFFCLGLYMVNHAPTEFIYFNF